MSSTASDNSTPRHFGKETGNYMQMLSLPSSSSRGSSISIPKKYKFNDGNKPNVKQKDIEVIILESDSEDEVVQKCSTRSPSSLSSIEAPKSQQAQDGTTDCITNQDHLTVQITDSSSSSNSSSSRHTPGKAQTKRPINRNKSTNGSIKRSKNASSSSKPENPQHQQQLSANFKYENKFGTFLSIASSSEYVPPRRAERLKRYRAWYRKDYQKDDSDDEDYQVEPKRKKETNP